MITDIRLQNFRSYQDASFEFEPGVNIIIGPNASGKTNLLESILVMARGKSYRAKDIELLAHGAEWARIDADTPQQTRTIKLEYREDKLEKSMSIGDKQIKRLTPAYIVPTVLFEPGHLQFLVGGPDLRREFLDAILEQTEPDYAKLWNGYRRTLTQRNALLKSVHEPLPDQLFVWNVRLSEFGAGIVRRRQQLIEQINERASTTYSAIAGTQSELELRYDPAVDADQYASYFLKRLEQRYQLDRVRGYTSSGPHREDIVLELNGHPQHHTASRGEVRTTLLALKIIELELLETATGQKPLLLLDDVFSELDGARRKALTKYLTDYQTFITTTDADVAKRQFQAAHLIAMS